MTQSKITFRNPVLSDRDVLAAQLERHAAQGLYSEGKPGKWAEAVRRLIEESAVADRARSLFIAEVDGKPVGYVVFRDRPQVTQNAVELWMAGLYDEYRGHGYGSVFVKGAIELVLAADSNRPCLARCYYQAGRMQKLLLAEGFVVLTRDPDGWLLGLHVSDALRTCATALYQSVDQVPPPH